MRLDWFVPAPAAHLPTLAQRLGIERTVAPGAVALTFDDGPHPEATPAVLELLARHGATATFFLVGEQVEGAQSWPARSMRPVTRSRCMGTGISLCSAGGGRTSQPISHARMR